MQEHARRMEIDLEIQWKENSQTPIPSQMTTNGFNNDDSMLGE